jgi:hypothetical protein
MSRCGFPLAPAPVLAKSSGSSSRELTSPSEFAIAQYPPLAAAKSTSHGVSVHFATFVCGVYSAAKIPTSPTFHPQRFSHSRWFTPPHTSWACFIPQPRAGFCTSGVFPTAQPTQLIEEPCPHAVVLHRLPQSYPHGASFGEFDFRALIQTAIRFCPQGV